MLLSGFPFILAREVDNRERPVVCSVSMDGCIASLKHTTYDTEGRVSQLALTNGATNTIENFWGPDLSGTEQGAGGIGGLIATSVNGQLYFPTYDHNGNITVTCKENGSAKTL